MSASTLAETFDPGAYVVPSSGMIVIAEVLEHFRAMSACRLRPCRLGMASRSRPKGSSSMTYIAAGRSSASTANLSPFPPKEPDHMPYKISRAAYAGMFGPTTGDKVRLADTELFIEIEKDFTTYGEEVKFGGGKVIRDGMGRARRRGRRARSIPSSPMR
jgi:hypothetical protein